METSKIHMESLYCKDELVDELVKGMAPHGNLRAQ